MFDDFTKEYPSTWNKTEVKEWKKKAILIIKEYYLAFKGHYWDQFEIPTERELLRAKVCFSLFGPPTREPKKDESIENAYYDEQKKKADEIIDKILEISKSRKEVKVSFLIIACKKEDSEFSLPIICVLAGRVNNKDIRQFVDNQGRIYKSWDDWKQNNTLPMLKYAYPTSGFLSCCEDKYEFDAERDPCVSFDTSPQCNLWTRILRQTDTASGITSLSCGVIGIASMFTPVGPVVLLGSAVCGGSSAAYGSARGACRLYDKGKHGESLVDLESMTIWLGIIATPLHAGTSIANYKLMQGAIVNGRIFSDSMQTDVTLLNFTTVGVDGVMISMALANMIEKYKNKELGPLDVVQFSMSVFFFTNTLIQPKVASSIIRKAQETHFQEITKSMTDANAKKTFQKFINDNRGDGTIKDNSKIVRTVNRINDPEAFFKSAQGAKKIEIGGRKGKTVMLNGSTTRINPNKVEITHSVQGQVLLKNQDVNKIKSAYNEQNIEDIELNNHKIFKNLNDRQKGRISRVRASSRKFDKNIINTAHSIAETLGCTTFDELMNVVEIVCAEVKGKIDQDLSQTLNHIKDAGQQNFINELKNDLNIAHQIASSANLEFSDDLAAVYHYRKHGNDFPTRILGNDIHFYLDKVPNRIFQNGNVTKVISLQDGAVRTCYTLPDDSFGVTTESTSGHVISSMYKIPGSFQGYIDRLQQRTQSCPQLDIVRQQLASHYRLSTLNIHISIDGRNPRPLENIQDLDHSVLEEIAQQLQAHLIEQDMDEGERE
ncbi:unnamed protein product [Meganyctiphanes norvegica]|uniref:DUF4781 domain-containing protein n=1 Tax=Meganyctiphanes norvegica TaxID=48144 RepID=A0AAV2RD81_MEGNR